MKQTYLLDDISALTPLELAECLIFLESPYFNRGALSKDVLKLYQIIVATAPEFSEASLDKKNVYPLVFPGKPFVEGKLEKLMAELNRLLRIFAVVNRKVSNTSEEHFQLEWIEWLRERGIKDRYMQAVSKFKTHRMISKIKKKYMKKREN